MGERERRKHKGKEVSLSSYFFYFMTEITVRTKGKSVAVVRMSKGSSTLQIQRCCFASEISN